MVNWKNPLFINTFTSLPGAFFSALPACPCADNYLIAVHAAAAQLPDLKIDDASLDADQLSGKDLLSACMPLAIAYADHQFGSYIPELGDGYELLLGDARNTYGNLWELQLKGAGPTPYSRMDEGRAVLRSSIREVLGYKAMSGLGILTTRAPCVTGSDTAEYRELAETTMTLRRLAPSHAHFGSFDVHNYRDQHHNLRLLADDVVQHHFPDLVGHPQAHVEPQNALFQDYAGRLPEWASNRELSCSS